MEILVLDHFAVRHMYLGMIDISQVVESTSFTDSRTSLDMDRTLNFDQFNLGMQPYAWSTESFHIQSVLIGVEY